MLWSAGYVMKLLKQEALTVVFKTLAVLVEEILGFLKVVVDGSL